MRWMNRLATMLITVAVVAGVPLVAGLWLRQNPWRPPTRAQIDTWIDQPLTDATIIAGCVAVAGIAWLGLVIYLAYSAITAVRRRIRRLQHLPVPTPAQMTASSMAGIAAFALPAATTAHPEPLPTATGTPQPADPARSAHHTDRPAQAQPAGITLPGGGWIPYRTAAAITALAAATWVQRRRSYRPDPHHPRDHTTDPDLQPLPGTVDTITTAVNDGETASRNHAPPALLPHELPDGILLLTGPGADAAARGLLVTAAVTGTRTVSLRPSDVPTLVPGAHATNPTVTRLAAPPGERSRPHAGTVISVGDEPAATHRWHVTADGTTTGTGLTDPRRLCTLEAQAAVDLLTLADTGNPSVSREDPQPAPALSRQAATVATPTTAAQLILLGSCHLAMSGQRVPLRRTASLQILAYLAVHPDGATRSDLIRAVWPHLPPASIVQRLHTTLTDLRQQLRPLLDGDPVTRHDDRYQLNTDIITTDLQHWRTAVHAMTHAAGTTAHHHACRDVADTYTGELAAGHTWAWIIPAREQARRTVIDACVSLADNDDGLPWLQRALTIDPYNQALHQQAAGLLRAAGDHAGADDLITRTRHGRTEESDPSVRD